MRMYVSISVYMYTSMYSRVYLYIYIYIYIYYVKISCTYIYIYIHVCISNSQGGLKETQTPPSAKALGWWLHGEQQRRMHEAGHHGSEEAGVEA